MPIIDGFELLNAPASYAEVQRRCVEVGYFPKRRSAVIGLDGYPGSGKSSLAGWLSWQLGCPAVHFDEYQMDEPGYVLDLDRVRDRIRKRIDDNRPVIVDGICLLEKMDEIGIKLDLHIWVRCDTGANLSSFNQAVWHYTKEYRQKNHAPDLVCEIEPSVYGLRKGPSRAWDVEKFED